MTLSLPVMFLFHRRLTITMTYEAAAEDLPTPSDDTKTIEQINNGKLILALYENKVY